MAGLLAHSRVLALTCVVWAAPHVVAPSHAQTPICATATASISVDFPTGGRHGCRIEDERNITLTVPPEGRPINSSPWYAFRIDASARTRLNVTLDYDYTEHRYPPHFTRDGVTWRPIAPSDVLIDDANHRATLRLHLAPGTTFIAGQPILTTGAMHDWVRTQVAGEGFETIEYGRSIDGAPLVAYVGGDGPELVVAITRQHPPETTGAAAFRAFVARIMSDDEQARAFRASHRILLFPAPNPDGVARGHWRWNNGGLDLNRDWQRLTQPETQGMTSLILREAENRATVAFLDFHSTGRNVIYAPPLDSPSPTISFLPFLRQQLDAGMRTPPAWSYNHTPETGNSKGWALETLAAPGITVELDDIANAETTQRVGEIVADALMQYQAAN